MARNLGLYCQGHSISEPRCLLSSRLAVREARMEPLSPLNPLCSRLPSRICSEGCIVSPLVALLLKRLQTHNRCGKLFLAPHLPAQPRPCPCQLQPGLQGSRRLCAHGTEATDGSKATQQGHRP